MLMTLLFMMSLRKTQAITVSRTSRSHLIALVPNISQDCGQHVPEDCENQGHVYQHQGSYITCETQLLLNHTDIETVKEFKLLCVTVDSRF